MNAVAVSMIVFHVGCALSAVAFAAVASWGVISDVRRRRAERGVELRSERCECCTGDASPCYVDGLGIGAAVLIKRNGRTGEIRQILLDGQRPQYDVRYVDLQQLVTNAWFVADELQALADREADPAAFATPYEWEEAAAPASDESPLVDCLPGRDLASAAE